MSAASFCGQPKTIATDSPITIAIADVEGAGEVDPELFRGAAVQQRPGLPALAGPAHRRIVRAVKRGIDAHAVVPHELRKTIARRRVLVFGQQALRDARLIRDDDRENPVVVERAYCLGRPGNQSNLVGVGEVVGVFDERAVAIEERGAGGTGHPASARVTAAASDSS